MTATKFAIVNGVKTNRKGIVAVCEWATYDVWGNRREGYQVNDVYRQSGEIRIPVTVTVSGMPKLPGASDPYRSFPDSSSITCEMMVSFEITERAIRKTLDISCKIETNGDDRVIYVERERDGYPLCEITVLRYEEDETEV